MKNEIKNTYEKPALTRYGTVEELTHGSSTGAALDADFENDTPRGELTFC